MEVGGGRVGGGVKQGRQLMKCVMADTRPHALGKGVSSDREETQERAHGLCVISKMKSAICLRGQPYTKDIYQRVKGWGEHQ